MTSPVRSSPAPAAPLPPQAAATPDAGLPPGASLDQVQSGSAVLRKGQGGPAVTELQQLLNDAGAQPPLQEDGNFGPKTEAALKAFQASHGLTADGTLNQASLAALDRPGSSVEQRDQGRARSGASTSVGSTASTRAPTQSQLDQPPAPGQVRAADLQRPEQPRRAPAAEGEVETRNDGAAVPRGQQQSPIPGYRPGTKLSPKVVAKANEVLKRGLPVGSTVNFEVDGKKYTARVEWHKHPPTDNVSAALKDWHRGVTIYQEK